MSDVTQAAAGSAAPQALTIAEARERYTASKAGAKQDGNPISEAARTLGGRAREARAQRQAEQARLTQEPPLGEGGDVEDDPAAAFAGETRDETETEASSDDAESDAQNESEDARLRGPQTIDLGDGVKVSLDEVRDGFMLKADHTRKTQNLAAERRQFESERTQRLRELEHLVGALKHQIPRPRSLKDWLAEDPQGGLGKFAEQTERLELLVNATRAGESQRARALLEAEAARDRDLAEGYNAEWSDHGKRQRDYAALSSFALKEGARPEELRGLTRPWMIRVMDKAAKYDALQASKGKVAKMIADKPKVVKPGAKVSHQAAGQSAIQNAHARLKTSGNLADAVALLRTMRAKGRAG
jgi:hypothetical protein